MRRNYWMRTEYLRPFGVLFCIQGFYKMECERTVRVDARVRLGWGILEADSES